MADGKPGADSQLEDSQGESREEGPLHHEVAAAMEKVGEHLQRESLREGPGNGRDLIQLQIAHSLSLALADSVAQTRRLQTLAMAGQAAAQRRLLDGGDPETARLAAQMGHEAVEASTQETVELARTALELFQKSETHRRHEQQDD